MADDKKITNEKPVKIDGTMEELAKKAMDIYAEDSEDLRIDSFIKAFDNVAQEDEDGIEFWSARDMQKLMGYRWENFINVIEKAKNACLSSKMNVLEHFRDSTKVLEVGNKARQSIFDVQLTRYACYLIAQNADPSKPIVGFAQTYFALQTRRQEIADQGQPLNEDQLRLFTRTQIKEFNKKLFAVANHAGVIEPKDYAIFNSKGYQGLYGGETATAIKKRKGIIKGNILDNMGSEELGANLFRITQTKAKLEKDNIQNKHEAYSTHYEVGKKVRDAIKEIGGTLPEELPVPEKSIKQVESESKKKLR